jgi:hypothetical protein
VRRDCCTDRNANLSRRVRLYREICVERTIELNNAKKTREQKGRKKIMGV